METKTQAPHIIALSSSEQLSTMDTTFSRSIVCRPLELAEIDAFTEFHVQCWKESYRDIMTEQFIEGLNFVGRSRWMADGIKDGSVCMLVAEIEGSFIGYIALTPPYSDKDKERGRVVEMLGLYILPAYWGTGLAQALFDKAVEAIGGQPYEELTLWVIAANERAIGFYTKNGFTPDGSVNPGDPVKWPYPEIRMTRPRHASRNSC